MDAANPNRIDTPDQEDDHHDGGDLHDLHGFAAGLFDALDVLPPVENGDDGGKDGRRVVHVELKGIVVRIHQRRRQPMAVIGNRHQLIHQPGNILSRGDAGDGAGEDVVEHQSGDAELGEGSSQRFFDHAVNAAAGEHGTAFNVHRAHREAEQHDAEDEPRGGRTDCLLGDAAGIEG